MASSQTLKTNPIPTSGWVLDTNKLRGVSGSYAVEANSVYGSYTPEKALDGDMDTEYRSNGGETTLKITFPAPIKIKKFKFSVLDFIILLFVVSIKKKSDFLRLIKKIVILLWLILNRKVRWII